MKEGLCQEKQKKMGYKTNCCTQCVSYVKLILLIEVIIFFGWCCYIILLTYRPGEIKNEATNITFEKYLSIIQSLYKTEKVHPSSDMSKTIVKSDIVNKINDFRKDMKFAKDQDLIENDIIKNVFKTNKQNFDDTQSDGINFISKLLLSGNSVHDKQFSMKLSEKPLLIEFVDENINNNNNNNNNDNNEEFIYNSQFLKKLRNISKIKESDDLENTEDSNNFIKNDHLMSESQKQNFLFDRYDELEVLVNLGLIICSSNKTNEFFNFFIKNLFKDFISSQSISTREISKQLENESINDIVDNNKDKNDVNDEEIETLENDKAVNTIELQEIMNKKISNSASFIDVPDRALTNAFSNEENGSDYLFYDSLFYDSNEEEVKQVTTESSNSNFAFSIYGLSKEYNPFLDIFNVQQQKKLQIDKEHDYLDEINDTETIMKEKKKKLIFLFKNKLSIIMSQYLHSFFNKNNYHNFCNVFDYVRIISQYLRHEQYVALRKFLEFIEFKQFT